MSSIGSSASGNSSATASSSSSATASSSSSATASSSLSATASTHEPIASIAASTEENTVDLSLVPDPVPDLDLVAAAALIFLHESWSEVEKLEKCKEEATYNALLKHCSFKCFWLLKNTLITSTLLYTVRWLK